MRFVQMAELLPLEIEMFWDAAIERHRREKLLAEIDEALDAGDSEAFYWLTSQLQEGEHVRSED